MRKKKDPITYLNQELSNTTYLAEVEKHGREPDCYLIFRSQNGALVGEPVEIYGTKQGLYKNFPSLVDRIDEKWGIEALTWWFDD